MWKKKYFQPEAQLKAGLFTHGWAEKQCVSFLRRFFIYLFGIFIYFKDEYSFMCQLKQWPVRFTQLQLYFFLFYFKFVLLCINPPRPPKKIILKWYEGWTLKHCIFICHIVYIPIWYMWSICNINDIHNTIKQQLQTLNSQSLICWKQRSLVNYTFN